ncbi:hypothetical protein BDM02DRAFT_896815 [Thelephora ganbajun]|uniref:Uncharacterized protein n=1 Tax=Thelephora ganbajun TaxID=370292 RepID=A0ACB6ZNJ9_THEGA|nr:hypothetical protein BDM02DRAFT_896815 [Thelephora ganbajun]
MQPPSAPVCACVDERLTTYISIVIVEMTAISPGLGRFPVPQVCHMFLNPKPYRTPSCGIRGQDRPIIRSPCLACTDGCKKESRDLRCNRGNYIFNPERRPSSPVRVHRSFRRRPPPAHHDTSAGFRISNNAGVSDACCVCASLAPAVDSSPTRPPRKAIHS